MCLYTKQKEPIILEDDLIVYKVLCRRCVTPFKHKMLYKNILYNTNNEAEDITNIGDIRRIEGGFFHSYLTFECALNFTFELSFYLTLH